MDLERALMLLNVVHMTAGEPRFRHLHSAAAEELAAMQAKPEPSTPVAIPSTPDLEEVEEAETQDGLRRI